MCLTQSVSAQQIPSPISVAKAVAIDLTSSKTDPTNFAFNAFGDSEDTASCAEDAMSSCISRWSSISDSSDVSDSDPEIPNTSGQITIDLMPSGAFGDDARLRLKRFSNVEGNDHIVLDLSDFASARA